MKRYELIVVLRATLADEERQTLIDRIVDLVKGGDKEALDPVINQWGERKLAYEIKKQNTGYYIFMECEMAGENIRELERSLKFMDDVLRHLVVLADAGKFNFDYKDPSTLQNYVTEHGHIIPRRRNRISAKMQRNLANAVKRARHLALMPFVVE